MEQPGARARGRVAVVDRYGRVAASKAEAGEANSFTGEQMRVQITFDVELPKIGATETEIEEYLRFACNDNGVLSGVNPFAETESDELEPIFGSFKWQIVGNR